MKKAFGILGGMGPQASAQMCQTLIDLSMREFGAKNGDEFPEFIMQSIPVADFISSEKAKKNALILLKQKVLKLNNLDLSSLSIACNTAHLLLPELQKVSKQPFVSMIEQVALAVHMSGIKKVGLLGSPSTLRSNIYQSALEEFHIEVVLPKNDEFLLIEKVIRNVIGGIATKKDGLILARIARSMEKRGAHGVVLGCTELPLVFPKNFSMMVFNSIEILARALLRNYFK